MPHGSSHSFYSHSCSVQIYVTCLKKIAEASAAHQNQEQKELPSPLWPGRPPPAGSEKPAAPFLIHGCCKNPPGSPRPSSGPDGCPSDWGVRRGSPPRCRWTRWSAPPLVWRLKLCSNWGENTRTEMKKTQADLGADVQLFSPQNGLLLLPAGSQTALTAAEGEGSPHLHTERPILTRTLKEPKHVRPKSSSFLSEQENKSSLSPPFVPAVMRSHPGLGEGWLPITLSCDQKQGRRSDNTGRLRNEWNVYPTGIRNS